MAPLPSGREIASGHAGLAEPLRKVGWQSGPLDSACQIRYRATNLNVALCKIMNLIRGFVLNVDAMTLVDI